MPVFVADVKGDVSGLAAPGEAGAVAEKRMTDLGLPFAPDRLPGRVPVARRHRPRRAGPRDGVGLRAAAAGQGPARPTRPRSRASALVFHYADSKGLPLLDLADLRALLTFLDSDAGKAELEGIGGLAKATVGVLLRALVGLEDGGGNEFFGEPQLDIDDLLRIAPDGRGVDLGASSCPRSRTSPRCSRPR